MSVVRQLVGFGLRQALGESAENLTGLVEQYVRDHGQTLPRALDRAHDRAGRHSASPWQEMVCSTACVSFSPRATTRACVNRFVSLWTVSTASVAGTSGEFRRDCLDELKRLRKSGLLSMQGMPAAEIARLAASCPRFTETNGLIEGARLAVTQ